MLLNRYLPSGLHVVFKLLYYVSWKQYAFYVTVKVIVYKALYTKLGNTIFKYNEWMTAQILAYKGSMELGTLGRLVFYMIGPDAYLKGICLKVWHALIKVYHNRGKYDKAHRGLVKHVKKQNKKHGKQVKKRKAWYKHGNLGKLVLQV